MRVLYEDEISDWLAGKRKWWPLAGFMAFILAPFIYVGITLWVHKGHLEYALTDAKLLMTSQVSKREKATTTEKGQEE